VGARLAIGRLLDTAAHGLSQSIAGLLLILIFNVILRRTWLASIAFCIVWILIASPRAAGSIRGFFVIGVMAAGGTFLIIRFGLLAVLASTTIFSTIGPSPLVVGADPWSHAVPLLAAAAQPSEGSCWGGEEDLRLSAAAGRSGHRWEGLNRNRYSQSPERTIVERGNVLYEAARGALEIALKVCAVVRQGLPLPG